MDLQTDDKKRKLSSGDDEYEDYDRKRQRVDEDSEREDSQEDSESELTEQDDQTNDDINTSISNNRVDDDFGLNFMFTSTSTTISTSIFVTISTSTTVTISTTFTVSTSTTISTSTTTSTLFKNEKNKIVKVSTRWVLLTHTHTDVSLITNFVDSVIDKTIVHTKVTVSPVQVTNTVVSTIFKTKTIPSKIIKTKFTVSTFTHTEVVVSISPSVVEIPIDSTSVHLIVEKQQPDGENVALDTDTMWITSYTVQPISITRTTWLVNRDTSYKTDTVTNTVVDTQFSFLTITKTLIDTKISVSIYTHTISAVQSSSTTPSTVYDIESSMTDVLPQVVLPTISLPSVHFSQFESNDLAAIVEQGQNYRMTTVRPRRDIKNKNYLEKNREIFQLMEHITSEIEQQTDRLKNRDFTGFSCNERIDLITNEDELYGYYNPILGVDLTEIIFCGTESCYQLSHDANNLKPIRLSDQSFCHFYEEISNDHLYCKTRNHKYPSCMFSLPNNHCNFYIVDDDNVKNETVNLRTAKLFPEHNVMIQNITPTSNNVELNSFRGRVEKLKYFLSKEDVDNNFADTWSFKTYLLEKLRNNTIMIGFSLVGLLFSSVTCGIFVYNFCAKFKRYSPVPTDKGETQGGASAPPLEQLDQGEGLEMTARSAEQRGRKKAK